MCVSISLGFRSLSVGQSIFETGRVLLDFILKTFSYHTSEQAVHWGSCLTKFGLTITNPESLFGGEGRELERYGFISPNGGNDAISPLVLYIGEVSHLIGKSDHWKLESLSGSVCLYQHLEEAPITTTRNSVPPQRAQHVSIMNAQKLSSFLRLFSSVFFMSGWKGPLKTSLQWGILGFLGWGWRQKGWGAAASSILGTGAGFPPRQHAPALQMQLRGTVELLRPSSQTAFLAAVIYIPQTALFTQTAWMQINVRKCRSQWGVQQ